MDEGCFWFNVLNINFLSLSSDGHQHSLCGTVWTERICLCDSHIKKTFPLQPEGLHLGRGWCGDAVPAPAAGTVEWAAAGRKGIISK